MKKKTRVIIKRNLSAWSLDQLTKSEFFHQKLHEWGLLTIATQIEKVRGETLDWDLSLLEISKPVWNKLIHRGIRPVIVFAHPAILTGIAGSVGYYRMMSMVSQKSMSRIGLPPGRYESGKVFPEEGAALRIAKHLNQIVSHLVEADQQIDDLEINRHVVTDWFTIEDVLESEPKRERIFKLLHI